MLCDGHLRETQGRSHPQWILPPAPYHRPIRPERHVYNSIATIRHPLTAAIAQSSAMSLRRQGNAQFAKFMTR
jgi:hypothetical protein